MATQQTPTTNIWITTCCFKLFQVIFSSFIWFLKWRSLLNAVSGTDSSFYLPVRDPPTLGTTGLVKVQTKKNICRPHELIKKHSWHYYRSWILNLIVVALFVERLFGCFLFFESRNVPVTLREQPKQLNIFWRNGKKSKESKALQKVTI